MIFSEKKLPALLPAASAFPPSPPRPQRRWLWLLVAAALFSAVALRFAAALLPTTSRGSVLSLVPPSSRRWTSEEARDFFASHPELAVAGNRSAHPDALLEGRKPRWTADQANEWYKAQPWLVGSDYIPAYAGNQLEMFQAATFNLTAIRLELDLAEQLGMTTMRVFLHDLLYQYEPEAFFAHLDAFLDVCSERGIRPMLVFFDSCWDAYPVIGPQRPPVPRVHNSRWVKSPNINALRDISEYRRLKEYVYAVIGRFKSDDRILMWDVWNEPENGVGDNYPIIYKLIQDVFDWVRDAGATQPVTSGIWAGNGNEWGSDETTSEYGRMQTAFSDIITFHNYNEPRTFENCIFALQRFGRPIIATEWLARGQGNTVRGILPIAKYEKVGMINWGFVSGKTNTIYPWDSWWKKYEGEPVPWHHDLFREDHTPYSQDEFNAIRELTGKKK